jgi:NAD-binding of NADP-dependent 3-hydroxyisobutyrate dehydrogenase
MMLQECDAVKSQLQIFVKDLDIVHAEAKRLQSPIPMASAAFQQYVSGQSLGLGEKDDSQIIQVYERITGVKVGNLQQTRGVSIDDKPEGENVGDYWRLPTGAMELIVEVGSEPRHNIVLANEFVRAMRVCFPPKDTTLAHRHEQDSVYFFLVQGGLDVVNHVKGKDPACDCMDFGEVRYGTHKTDTPLVHKITNMADKEMLCIDAEILRRPPVTAVIPLVAENHELVKTRDKCRVYKLTLEPGESVTVSYPFFHLSVVMQPGTIQKDIGGRIQWIESSELGDVVWKEPVLEVKKRNVGTSVFVEYITEWC